MPMLIWKQYRALTNHPRRLADLREDQKIMPQESNRPTYGVLGEFRGPRQFYILHQDGEAAGLIVAAVTRAALALQPHQELIEGPFPTFKAAWHELNGEHEDYPFSD
jgi:hypothetical protein